MRRSAVPLYLLWCVACASQEPKPQASDTARVHPPTATPPTTIPSEAPLMTVTTYGPPPTANDTRAFEAVVGELSFRAKSVSGFHGASSSCTIVALPAGEAAVAAAAPIISLNEACTGILAGSDFLVVLGERGIYGYSLRGEQRFSVAAPNANWPALVTSSHVFARSEQGIVRIDHKRGVLTQTWPYPSSVQVRVLAPDGEQMYALLHVQETREKSVSRLVQLLPTVPPTESLIHTVNNVPALNPAVRPMGSAIEFRLNTEWYRDSVPSRPAQ